MFESNTHMLLGVESEDSNKNKAYISDYDNLIFELSKPRIGVEKNSRNSRVIIQETMIPGQMRDINVNFFLNIYLNRKSKI